MAICKHYRVRQSALWTHIRNGHHVRVLGRLDRSARMVALEDLHDSTRAVAEETLALLRESTDPKIQLGAIARLQASIELAGKLTGKISTGTINQFLVSIGARDEDEVRRAVRMLRTGEDVRPQDAFHDALEILVLAVREEPRLLRVVLGRLGLEAPAAQGPALLPPGGQNGAREGSGA